MSLQKRKNNYFHNNGNNHSRYKRLNLEAGMSGFLCTCNFREKDCVRDAYKLLNEFADEIYGPDIKKEIGQSSAKVLKNEKDISVTKTEEDKEEDEDISVALNKEINELKAEYAKPMTTRRFQVVDTGVKNVIFIKSTLTNPLELVTRIITKLNETKQQQTRFLLRLLPIEAVCKAYMNDIRAKAEVVLEKYFAQEPKTFSIVFNRHSNNNIKKDEVIEDIAEIISKKNPGNKVDLKNPELAVIVEVIRGVCLMSVAPNYYKFKKYNLLEICNAKESTNDIQDKNKNNSENNLNNEDTKETDTIEEIAEKCTEPNDME